VTFDFDPRRRQNGRLLERLADLKGPVDEPTFLDETAVTKLSTENAWLEAETQRTLPESPWYRSIAIAILVGVTAGVLFLMK
jgi:hypothetical protein